VEVTVINPTADTGVQTSREFQPQEPEASQTDDAVQFLPLNDSATEQNKSTRDSGADEVVKVNDAISVVVGDSAAGE
jgi:hypothetical protein